MIQSSSPRMDRPSRHAATGPAVLAAGSLAVVAAAVGLLAWLSISTNHPTMTQPLLVYCAASVQPALEPIAKAYEQETLIPVSIQVGSSGALETQIRLSG